MDRAIGVAATAVILAAGVAQAQPVSQKPTSERLVMQAPPGPAWTRTADRTAPDGSWSHEAIPPGESADDFSEILADQGFPGLTGVDPADFLKQRFVQDALSCDSVRVIGPTARVEGGVRVVYGQLYCGEQRGQDFGDHVFFKVMLGEAALYAVSLDVRTPASSAAGVLSFPPGHEADMQALLQTESAANGYIGSGVYLCGGRSTDPRCGK
jgi:hypothetical protein